LEANPLFYDGDLIRLARVAQLAEYRSQSRLIHPNAAPGMNDDTTLPFSFPAVRTKKL